MKAISAALLLCCLATAHLVAGDQPADNNVRYAEFVRCQDGDTVTLNIYLGDRVWIRNRKIRLKDVRCHEVGTEPGLAARRVLEQLMLSGPVSVQLTTQQTYDRVVGIVWAGGVNVNEEMKKQPQGGR